MTGYGKVPISELKAACEVYNGDLTDFENVLLIERTVFPLIKIQTSKKEK